MAKVTGDPALAARLALEGTPVVLVCPEAAALGRFVASLGGRQAPPAGAAAERADRCLVGGLVGDLSDPVVAAAAAEMAAEMWPWARGHEVGPELGRAGQA